MELIELLQILQSDYVAQFEAAYEQESDRNEQVFPEIAVEFSGETYRKLYVIDFLARNGDSNTVIEVIPEVSTYDGNQRFEYRNLNILIGQVSWDAMRLHVEPAPKSLDATLGFSDWFDRWIDLDGEHKNGGELLSGVIHNIALYNDVIEVDFGSEPPEAAIALFEIIEANGGETILVSSSRHK